MSHHANMLVVDSLSAIVRYCCLRLFRTEHQEPPSPSRLTPQCLEIDNILSNQTGLHEYPRHHFRKLACQFEWHDVTNLGVLRC